MSKTKTVLEKREIEILATYRQDGLGKLILKHPAFKTGKIFTVKQDGWHSDCGTYLVIETEGE